MWAPLRSPLLPFPSLPFVPFAGSELSLYRDASAPWRWISVQNCSGRGASLGLQWFTVLERMFWDHVTKINHFLQNMSALVSVPLQIQSDLWLPGRVSAGATGWLGRASLLLCIPPVWWETELNWNVSCVTYADQQAGLCCSFPGGTDLASCGKSTRMFRRRGESPGKTHEEGVMGTSQMFDKGFWIWREIERRESRSVGWWCRGLRCQVRCYHWAQGWG